MSLQHLPGIGAPHMQRLRTIFGEHLPATAEIWLFGSRVVGNFAPHSDLDVCLRAAHKLDLLVLGEVREALASSDLPYLVDVVDWHRATPALRHVIEETGIRLSPIGGAQSALQSAMPK